MVYNIEEPYDIEVFDVEATILMNEVFDVEATILITIYYY